MVRWLLGMRRPQILVDCSLFQGSKTLKALNYNDFPFSPGDWVARRERTTMTYAPMRQTHHSGLSHRRNPYSVLVTIYVVSSVLMNFVAAPAIAQVPSGDVNAGRQIVQASCSTCHEERRPLSAPQKGPSLQAIAAMPSTTSMSLHVFLLTPHANMPNYRLSPQEIDDVAAYILSLRG